MTPAANPFVEHVLDQLQRIAPVTARSMFGGHGIYLDGVMFALIAYDTLYFKAGDANRADFEAAGCGPFVYEGKGRPVQMSYYQLPEHVFEDLDQLEPWMRAAHAVAVEAKAKQPKRRAKRRAK